MVLCSRAPSGLRGMLVAVGCTRSEACVGAFS